jgi:hypothetical protein
MVVMASFIYHGFTAFCSFGIVSVTSQIHDAPCYYRLYDIENYEPLVASNGEKCILNFIKIHPSLFSLKKLTDTLTGTNTDDWRDVTAPYIFFSCALFK